MSNESNAINLTDGRKMQFSELCFKLNDRRQPQKQQQEQQQPVQHEQQKQQ